MKGAQITLDFTIHFADLTFGNLLGQGAYGKVFAGEWQFNPVAIKQYASQDFSELTQNEILQEASVMANASTQSDYLVRLRGIVLEKPHYSLVMEYMPGGDLFRLLKSSQALTWTMRYRISLDMTIGLHHLHQQGILHRDLKSLNVLLDINFRAKLADFGLSTLKTSSSSTTASEFKGTLLWAAPELFKRGSKATKASDLYALAMVFWELITRRIPFSDAPNSAIAIDWVKSGEQETIPESTPEEFKTIILNCWHKDPTQRPEAAEVAKQLDTLWQSERQKASTSSNSSTSSSSMNSSHSSSAGSGSTTLSEGLSPEAKLSLMVFLNPPAIRIPLRLEEIKAFQQQPEPKIESKKLSKLLNLDDPVDSPLAPMRPLSQNQFILAHAPKLVEKSVVDQKTLGKLLQFVAEGEQDLAEALIKKDNQLLRYAGIVKDLSGREFKQITAFQYAVWALDWHMWTMIRQYLPQAVQTEQLQTLESQGTSYDSHFNLKELMEALQTYVDQVATVWKTGQHAKDHWATVVGGAQKRLPAHIVNEYTRPDRHFEPCPIEWKSPLPRTRAIELWDHTQSQYIKADWFADRSSAEGLGRTYAVLRYNSPPSAWGSGCGITRSLCVGKWLVQADLQALQVLWKTRTEQLQQLKSELLTNSKSFTSQR